MEYGDDKAEDSPFIQHMLSLGLERLYQIAGAETYEERYQLLYFPAIAHPPRVLSFTNGCKAQTNRTITSSSMIQHRGMNPSISNSRSLLIRIAVRRTSGDGHIKKKAGQIGCTKRTVLVYASGDMSCGTGLGWKRLTSSRSRGRRIWIIREIRFWRNKRWRGNEPTWKVHGERGSRST